MHIIKTKGPAIIAMNHPNAFTDPIVITTLVHPMKLKYLARGDAFKPGLVAWTLESIGIVPIFRIQDGGKEGLKRNEDAYRRVNYLLNHNCKIIVFAEGLCIQERRLRPLKKGVSRMVFGAYESLPHDDLVVIPVGVNYSKADKFRSTIFYNIGEPIPVKQYMEEHSKNPAKANNILLHDLAPRMKELITHINNPDDDIVVEHIETLCKKNMLLQQNLKPTLLEHDFIVAQQITEKVNITSAQKPDLVKEFRNKAISYFALLKKYKMRDWLIDPLQNKHANFGILFLRLLIVVLGFPIYAVALVGNYTAFKLTDLLAKKVARNKEFYSSFAIGFGMAIFLLTYILWYFVLHLILPVNIWPPFILLIFGLSAWYSLYYYPFAKKTFGLYRYLTSRKTVEVLYNLRLELISLINKF